MNDDRVEITFLKKGGSSFIVGAIESKLKEMGIDFNEAEASVAELQELPMLTPLIVGEAEMLLDEDRARVFLYDKCIEQRARLILIGQSDDIKRLSGITTASLIAATFSRPVNANEVAQRLYVLLEDIHLLGYKKRILVVDDSPVFLRTVSEWLENDYQVSISPSAAAAFRMIETSRPDLILLDYEMPVCSGAQFMEMLSTDEKNRDIPIIFLTSKNDESTVKEVLALKPQGYLLKTQTKEAILGFIIKFFMEQDMLL